ncbi:unnamed protein product [Hyaloperonospora brassicae]|uniref:Probable pectate lyase F n=1 Tax=Hyaloperonospora brassicae TaxID=162125 RepID=A0AAV0TNH1_HYABA|nr:unnamed protein product [Hyaloperonospora brassicae]CAI5723648.1 unnamed protein product [Hyaloperonospora brassicae]
MVNAISFVALVFAASAAVTSAVSMRAEAAPMPNGAWPSSQGDVKFAAPYTVKKGEVFDGKMKTYQRSNVKCRGGMESSWRNAVFVVQEGGTLKNAIIGGSKSSVTRVIGGGARSAADKVVQHNGYGSLIIEGFYAVNYGTFCRMCGDCGNKGVAISLKNVFAVNGRVRLVTQNEGDKVTVGGIKIKGKKVEVCSVGTGASRTSCNYSPSSVTYV